MQNSSFPPAPPQNGKYPGAVDEGYEAFRKYGSMPIDDNGNYRHFNINQNQMPISPMAAVNGGRLAANGGVYSHHGGVGEHNMMALSTSKIEMDVQALNHCFDDIERFVARLQNATEYYKELERRQKQRKSQKKHLGDGMLSMRAQMPPPQHFVDIFQKFKYSFNLLAKLKAYIHDPNAPELVHFLFTPLALIVNAAAKDPQYRGLIKTVWTPLLNRDAKELLFNCLTSKEQDLWQSLGDAWTTCREETLKQPGAFPHLDQIYNPIFYDAWSGVPQSSSSSSSRPVGNTNYDFSDGPSRNELSRLAQYNAATGAGRESLANGHMAPTSQHKHGARVDERDTTMPMSANLTAAAKQTPVNNNQQASSQSSKFSSTNGSSLNNTTNMNSAAQLRPTTTSSNESSAISSKVATANIRNYEEMKKWAIDLSYRGAK